MFEELNLSYADLTPDQREKVSAVLLLRAEMLDHQKKINALRIDLTRKYSPEGEEMLANYAQFNMAQTRAKLNEATKEVLKEAIDSEKIIGLIPSILSGITTAINFPLLFTGLGVDPDVALAHLEVLKDIIREGMED